mmetsp:Transcript_28349/g.93887  ORF Transcript_28349/g.93887 Transcript_28349/m.93887 type:complete len:237 (+) Transcript_28349:83-793(+)
MAPSRKRAKPSKPLASAVALWIEEQEATANLWLLVSEPDAPQQIRIPARRDFISHFSELIRSLDADDSECPVIGFYAETVVEFCRACMPHLNGLPPWDIEKTAELCRLIKLAHFLAAPQLTNHFMNELQGRDILEANEFIAFFDMTRHVGKTIFCKERLEHCIPDFMETYPQCYSERQKKTYEKEIHQLFTIAVKEMKAETEDRSKWTTKDYEQELEYHEKLAERLLDMARPASTS